MIPSRPRLERLPALARTCDQPFGANRYRGMPARSKKQQKAAGAALAAKRGEQKKSSLKGPSRKMAASMSEKQLRDLAKTKRKKLPTKKK
jgi:Protein of unknwon function (DUF3008)